MGYPHTKGGKAVPPQMLLNHNSHGNYPWPREMLAEDDGRIGNRSPKTWATGFPPHEFTEPDPPKGKYTIHASLEQHTCRQRQLGLLMFSYATHEQMSPDNGGRGSRDRCGLRDRKGQTEFPNEEGRSATCIYPSTGITPTAFCSKWCN